MYDWLLWKQVLEPIEAKSLQVGHKTNIDIEQLELIILDPYLLQLAQIVQVRWQAAKPVALHMQHFQGNHVPDPEHQVIEKIVGQLQRFHPVHVLHFAGNHLELV